MKTINPMFKTPDFAPMMWTAVETWVQTVEKMNGQAFSRLHEQVKVATEMTDASMRNVDEAINLFQSNVQSAMNVWKTSLKDLQTAQEKALETKES